MSGDLTAGNPTPWPAPPGPGEQRLRSTPMSSPTVGAAGAGGGGTLQAALADEEKDAAAVEKVKRVCDAFHAFRAQCLAAIDADAGPVLDWLRANVAPEACGKLGLCPPAEAEGGAPWGAARVDVA